jgi:hypothetical protein
MNASEFTQRKSRTEVEDQFPPNSLKIFYFIEEKNCYHIHIEEK